MIRLLGELENGPAWSNSSESSDDSTSPQLPAHPKVTQNRYVTLIYDMIILRIQMYLSSSDSEGLQLFEQYTVTKVL